MALIYPINLWDVIRTGLGPFPLVKQDCIVIYRASIYSLMKIIYNFLQDLNARGSERAMFQSAD
jgi:hypothetical protein